MVQTWFYITCQNTASIAECTSTMQKIHRYQLYQIYIKCNRDKQQTFNNRKAATYIIIFDDYV